MNYCVVCSSSYPISESQCIKCGFSPACVDGFKVYAPELANENQGFKAEYFADLAPLEAQNFWFKIRNRLIIWTLKTYSPKFKSLLEIGCGTGFVLSGIANAFPDSRLSGSEIFLNGLKFTKSRLPHVDLMQIDAQAIPFREEYDVICAFDVLEHIENDDLVLSQIHAALTVGGYMLITVPQHQWLWSQSDIYACHCRRYSAKEIHEKILKAGFKIKRSTSFVSILLPAMMLSRSLNTNKSTLEYDPTAELSLGYWLNTLFYFLMCVEFAVIWLGFNFPVGGSRIIVAKK